LPSCPRLDKQPLKAPQKTEIGTQDKMRGIDKEDGSLTRFCLFQSWF
jgi:hypothetical protein